MQGIMDTDSKRYVEENIENGEKFRLEMKQRGLRVFYAYKKNGVYYIQDYTSPKTKTMEYQITRDLDILMAEMGRMSPLNHWWVDDEAHKQSHPKSL